MANYNILMATAEGQASSISLDYAAKALALKSKVDAETTSYGSILAKFNELYKGTFTKEQLLQLIFLQSLEQSTVAGSILDISIPETLLSTRKQ